MPAIPAFTARTSPEMVPQQRIDTATFSRGATQVAEAGAKAADMFAQLAAATQQAQQAQDLVAARTAHTVGLAELRARLENDPNVGPADIRAQWDTGRAAIRERVTSQFPQVGRQFGLAAQQVEAGELAGVVKLQATRTAEAGRANLSRDIDLLSDQAAAARDPGERGRLLGQIEGSIATAVQNRYLAADDAEKMRQRSLGRLDNAAVIGLIRGNPMQAMAALSDPARFTNLDPVQRERLANTAMQGMQAGATAALAAETRAARVQRENADRVANDIHGRIAQAEQGQGPMPTIADVQAQREWLSPGETASLYGRIRDANQVRDVPAARIDLEGQVDQLDPVAFDARIRRAVEARQISGETAASLLRANRSARRDDGPPAPATAARTFVRESLDPGDAPMGNLMREQLTRRQLNAVADIERFSRENPNATPEDYDRQSRAVVARYRETTAAQDRLTLARPYGFNGARAQVTEATLQQAARALLTARISDAERARELETLDAWRATMTPPEPAAPTTPTRGNGPRNTTR